MIYNLRKQRLYALKQLKIKLSFNHINDDDPTGQFLTVKEKREWIREQIRLLTSTQKQADGNG